MREGDVIEEHVVIATVALRINTHLRTPIVHYAMLRSVRKEGDSCQLGFCGPNNDLSLG
jgi:hypothetical protein